MTAFGVRPLVSWPRRATAGEKYLLTIDLEPDDPRAPWPYEQEEITVHCLVETAPLFTSEAIGETSVVMHRFGGTYGPVRYVITAARRPMEGAIHVALMNANGVPIAGYRLDGVQVIADHEEREPVSDVTAPASTPAAPPTDGPLVLGGRLVTFDPDRRVIEDGRLYVGDDGRISAVTAASEPAPAGFADVPVVTVSGSIYPGLIDLLARLSYSTLPLWNPGRPFTSRYQWPEHPSYRERVADPARALGALAAEAALRYGEVKALIGGVAAAGYVVTPPPKDWTLTELQRGVIPGRLGMRTRTTAFRPDEYEEAAEHMREGVPLICNVAEGTDPQLRREFEELREHDCLQPQLIAAQCVALTGDDFATWREGTVLWSPFSNLWLYGATTDIIAAREAGLRMCLTPHFPPTGMKNLLGELKVADLVNRQWFSGALSDLELCEMATRNPAEALGMADSLGSLKPGCLANVIVVADRHSDPFRNLIEAREEDVRLVVVKGRRVYGEPEAMPSGAPGASAIRIAGRDRLVRLGTPGEAMTWAETQARLEQVRSEALRSIPIDSLVHDVDFLRQVADNRVHGGILNDLASYYL